MTRLKKNILFVFGLLFYMAPALTLAQTSTVALPSDGTSNQSTAPQGAFRFQRGFYLVNSKEMMRSGLKTGDSINCIGFTIGGAQNDSTKGKFKVYLQNTNDTSSRIDTNWIYATGITTNYYSPSGIFPANYEWQVKSNCAGGLFSPGILFSNLNLPSCQPPTNLRVVNTTSNTASLSWVAPAMATIKYYIDYKITDSAVWYSDSSVTNSIILSGLIANRDYECRVRTKCSATDFSSYSTESFKTEKTDVCNEPVPLPVSNITVSSATLKWTSAAGAVYYSIRFRMLGSENWNTTLSFTDSIKLNSGLVAGTGYEWQVQTNCAMGSGAFVAGSSFLMAGPLVCYTPGRFSTDSISENGVRFYWDSVPGVASYDLRYRAKDIIFWDNAIAPMHLIHHDSICIPDTIGTYYTPFSFLEQDTFFTYTGGALYVAWEYSRPSGPLSSFNTSFTTRTNSVLKGSSGQDSVNYILSFNTTGDTSMMTTDTIMYLSTYRPETYFCSPNTSDSVAVLAVYALGKYAPNYTTNPVTALIKNYSSWSSTYTVKLQVKDMATNLIRYSTQQNVLIGPDTTQLVEFSGWNPNLIEKDSILVFIDPLPMEDVIQNNRGHYLQQICPHIVSYDDGSKFISQAGTDTAGLTLSRHTMKGCGKINSVQVYLTQSSIGQGVYAVVLDSNKIILAQSDLFIPDSTQINEYHPFYMPDSRLLKDEIYYVGLAQTMGMQSYRPVGVQYEGLAIRDSVYYLGRISGDSLWHHPYPGRLMIKAEIIPGTSVSAISGDPFLCAGAVSDTLVASSLIARYADSLISVSSQYSNSDFTGQKALGLPDVYPKYGPDPQSWIGKEEMNREYITLQFSNPDSVNFIDIYETFNPGAVDSIYFIDELMNTYLVWTQPVQPVLPVARRNRIQFPDLTPYKVKGVRLSINAGAVNGLSGIDAVCIGRITTPGVFSSFLWSGPSSGTDDTLIISAPGTYHLTTVNSDGCTSSDSIVVTTPVVVNPVISLTGAMTFCPGDSVKLKTNMPGGNIWSNGLTGDSIYVKLPGTYYVTHDDGSACGISSSNSIILNHFASPLVNIIGDTVICPQGSTILSADGVFTRYQWNTGDTISSTLVNLPSYVGLTVTDMNGCKASDYSLVIPVPNPTPVISGTLLFCPEDSTLLRVNSNYNSYLWNTGATSDSIYALSPGNYTVTVVDSNGCMASTGVMTSLRTAPIASIIGNSGFCPADSVKLIGSGGQTFLWSTGSNSSEIYAHSSGTYILTITDIFGCKDTVHKQVQVYIPPSPMIAGSLAFCDGGSSTVLDAGLGYQNYLWSTGETSPSITVSQIGDYSVTVKDMNGCIGSDTVTTSNNGAVPDVPGPIAGNTFGMCNTLSPSTYSISPVNNTAKYVWTVPEGAYIMSGQGTTSIDVSFDQFFKGGNISVQGWNPCGLSPAFNGRYLYVYATPGSVPGNITGTTSGVCKIGTGTYSIPPITGAISYSWTVPLGAIILSGQNSPAIQVSFASSYKAGDICVQYNTLCGPSPFECLMVLPTPVLESGIIGNTTICTGTQNEMYSVAPTTGATDYEWAVPSDARIVSGQGTNQIKVNFGSRSGIITVIPINLCGSSTGQVIKVNTIKCNSIGNIPHTEKKQFEFELVVFPNPSEGELVVKINDFGSKGTYRLFIQDMVGRQVHENKLNTAVSSSHNLDLKSLAKGIYTIHIQNEQTIHSRKIILK